MARARNFSAGVRKSAPSTHKKPKAKAKPKSKSKQAASKSGSRSSGS